MAFHKINYETWERREFHEFFDGCSIYMTVAMDITDFLTRVKWSGIRFYPALIHCILQVVNGCADFRYGFDTDKNIGVWDTIHTMYTVPRRGNPALFSMAITEYEKKFTDFYEGFLADYARAETCGKLLSDEQRPDAMGITAVPGLHHSGFAFGGNDSKPDFTPFVVIGGYTEKDGRTMLPITGEFSHSVNDGYHITRFFDLLRERLELFLVESR